MSIETTFVNWKREAERCGWKVPVNDAMPKESWIFYWTAMEEYERKVAAGDRNPGRPVAPHRSGRAA